jgi:hypothetical protein
MHILKPSDIPPSEITPETIYRGRGEFFQGTGALVLAGMLTSGGTRAALSP